MPSQGLVLCATGLYVLMESASNEILFFESTCVATIIILAGVIVALDEHSGEY
jgi:hypothetical protein